MPRMKGNELRQRREAVGVSQAKFAELTGVSQHLISAYELGKTTLASATVLRLADALDDDGRVKRLVQRRKRYRHHHYRNNREDSNRAVQCLPTHGNKDYVKLLRELDDRRLAQMSGPAAFSVFSGCGGFSLGFAWAGYTVKGHVEADPAIQRMYARNFPSARNCGSDITRISDANLESLSKEMGPIDVLLGGPPCQGFSLAGKRNVHDPRNTLFQHYLRFVRHLQPKIALMENVRLLTSMKNDHGGPILEDILAGFHRVGYSVKHRVVNAKDFGVPQHRERVFLVATSGDLRRRLAYPSPTHGARRDMLSELHPYRTFGDACSDLDYIESGGSSRTDPHHKAVRHPEHVVAWLWNVGQGHSAHENDDENMRPPSGYNTTYKRQIWHEPGATVQTTFGMISGCRNVHPIATRSLTVREAARLQSFPDAFEFLGSKGSIGTAIGNAVPPLLSFAFAEVCKSAL